MAVVLSVMVSHFLPCTYLILYNVLHVEFSSYTDNIIFKGRIQDSTNGSTGWDNDAIGYDTAIFRIIDYTVRNWQFPLRGGARPPSAPPTIPRSAVIKRYGRTS